MTDTSPNLQIALVAESQATKYETVNDAVNALDGATAGFLSVAMTDADYTPSMVTAMPLRIFKFTGALTATRNIILPQVKKVYVIHNGTSGSHTLTVKTAAGGSPATASVANAAVKLVYCDGSNCYAMNPAAAQVRFTQAAIEAIISAASPNIRLSQAAIETIVAAAGPHVQLSQAAIEAVISAASPNIRLSQAAIEAILTAASPNVQLSQIAIEVVTN